jgi:hypothetical protein
VQVQKEILEKLERAFARNLFDYAQTVHAEAPEGTPEATECAGGVAAFYGGWLAAHLH